MMGRLESRLYESRILENVIKQNTRDNTYSTCVQETKSSVDWGNAVVVMNGEGLGGQCH